MKLVKNFLMLTACAVALGVGSTSALAQDAGGGGGGGGGGRGPRGDFNPEQMRQRMMDNYREQLAIKGDDEWKLIQDRIEKVMTARRDAGGFGGMGGMRRPNRDGGGQGGPGGGGPGGPGGGRGFRGEPIPEGEELQKAIDANASADEIKAKLAKYRDAKKSREASLEKAQEELRKVLTVRQEAAAVLGGLLK